MGHNDPQCYNGNMVERKTEIGIRKIFQGYCGFVLVYQLAFVAYTFFATRTLYTPSFLLFYINLGTFAILFGYLSWVWLEKKLGSLYFPIAILISTLVPTYSTIFFWPLQLTDPVTEIVFRSWYLLPILIVPFTLTAWQYGYKIALGFSILISFYDLPFIVFEIDSLSLEMIQMIGVPILRAIAFGTIGVIVGMLTERQRRQRRKLVQANFQLSKYAETLEELAISQERNRLARELHDTLAHTLSAQILALEALRLTPPKDETELDEILSEIIENFRKGLAETRRALKDLRSKQLEDLGLKQSLYKIIEDAASKANLETDLEISENLMELPDEVEDCIYRITTEGIENIIRHSFATRIKLRLLQKHDEVIFTLSDNGSGFDPKDFNNKEKHGIKGMKERALASGGKFQINSNPQKGTKIIVRFEVNDDPRFSL